MHENRRLRLKISASIQTVSLANDEGRNARLWGNPHWVVPPYAGEGRSMKGSSENMRALVGPLARNRGFSPVQESLLYPCDLAQHSGT